MFGHRLLHEAAKIVTGTEQVRILQTEIAQNFLIRPHGARNRLHDRCGTDILIPATGNLLANCRTPFVFALHRLLAPRPAKEKGLPAHARSSLRQDLPGAR